MAKKKKSFMTPKASRRKARKRLATTTSRAKKEFTYRGYSVADLKEMPLWPSEESDSMSVIELLPARARRTIARGLSEENERLLDRIRRTSGRTGGAQRHLAAAVAGEHANGGAAGGGEHLEGARGQADANLVAHRTFNDGGVAAGAGHLATVAGHVLHPALR